MPQVFWQFSTTVEMLQSANLHQAFPSLHDVTLLLTRNPDTSMMEIKYHYHIEINFTLD